MRGMAYYLHIRKKQKAVTGFTVNGKTVAD